MYSMRYCTRQTYAAANRSIVKQAVRKFERLRIAAVAAGGMCMLALSAALGRGLAPLSPIPVGIAAGAFRIHLYITVVYNSSVWRCCLPVHASAGRLCMGGAVLPEGFCCGGELQVLCTLQWDRHRLAAGCKSLWVQLVAVQ